MIEDTDHPDNVETVEVNDDLEPQVDLTDPTQEELDSAPDADHPYEDDEDPRADVPGDVL